MRCAPVHCQHSAICGHVRAALRAPRKVAHRRLASVQSGKVVRLPVVYRAEALHVAAVVLPWTGHQIANALEDPNPYALAVDHCYAIEGGVRGIRDVNVCLRPYLRVNLTSCQIGSARALESRPKGQTTALR